MIYVVKSTWSIVLWKNKDEALSSVKTESSDEPHYPDITSAVTTAASAFFSLKRHRCGR